MVFCLLCIVLLVVFYRQAFSILRCDVLSSFKHDLNRLERVIYMLCGHTIQPVSNQREGKCNELGILVIPLKTSTLGFEKNIFSSFSLNNNPPKSF